MINESNNGHNSDSNGLTPSKAKLLNSSKRLRFDDKRNLSNVSLSDSESDEDDKDITKQLEKQKQKNRDLKFIVGKLQKQLDLLTKEMGKTNNILTEMQNEKKTLIELLQKKNSPKKQSKKKNANKHNQNSTQQHSNKNAADISAASHLLNGMEGDGNSAHIDHDLPAQTQQNAMSDKNNAMDTTPAETQMHTNNERAVERESSDDSSESEEEDGIGSENDNDNVKPSNNKNTQNVKRSLKVPPVDIWANDRAQIQREIQETLPIDSCLFGRVNNGKFRVFACNETTRSNLIDFLKKKNYNYNTYTPSTEKMINVLIKGLDHIDEPRVIEDALANKGFVPHKIIKHVTGYMRKNDLKSNLWLVVLQPNTDTNELFKIKAIDHAIVKFEFLRKPKVIQCKRCQRFHHSASNCSLPYRCVKCTNSHEPGKCLSESKGNKFKPKCVNCQGNHTANDASNCPAFKKAIELKDSKQKKSSTKQNVSKPTTKSSAVRTSQSYSERVQMNQQQNTNGKHINKSIDQFVNAQNKMLSEFMRTIQQMQQQFIENFNRKNGQ